MQLDFSLVINYLELFGTYAMHVLRFKDSGTQSISCSKRVSGSRTHAKVRFIVTDSLIVVITGRTNPQLKAGF